MALSSAVKKVLLIGGVALTLHTGFLFIKPLVMPCKKADDGVLEKLKDI